MSEAVRVILAGGGTGGHLYPALAIGAAIRRVQPEAEVLYVGATRGIERRVLPERGVPHRLLPVEPIRREKVWRNWRVPVALVHSLLQLRAVFREFEPHVVVGTGGYASAPAVAWALLHRIPAAVQEQNSYPGMTTRLVARRVDALYLAFPEALEHLTTGSRTEVSVTGNPVSPPDRGADRAQALRGFGLEAERVVLVVGGSQGARAINEALLRDLAATGGEPAGIPEGTQILWATGPAHHEGVRERLASLGLSDKVKAVPYIDDMPAALSIADLAISRAGAMALSELSAWGIPSVLVPYPHATGDHQQHNAAAMTGAGAAVMVPEPELEPGRLWAEARALAADDERRGEMARRSAERGRPDAADVIARALIELAEGAV